jgi:hypothetical protein
VALLGIVGTESIFGDQVKRRHHAVTVNVDVQR